jgi:light-regulated signal transduction histidine kinase (bacteriophytochrome)
VGPSAIILTLLLGWFEGVGIRNHWFPPAVGTALLVIAVLAVLVAVLLVAGRSSDLAEQRCLEAAKDLERSEVRQREQLGRYATDLEAANAELDAFCYSVSHDLRAPLRSIDGFSLAAIEDYGDILGEAGCGHLERVRAATQRMAALIDDLLSLSRISRAEMRRETINLTELTRDIERELRQAHPHRAVELHVHGDLTIAADEALIRVLLTNLLGNAWKYTQSQGVAHIEVGADRSRGDLVFFVRDDGVGFDTTYADKLFTPFQRLHSASQFEGAGIGLATVQRIVHRHGGRTWAESQLDEGATFYFTVESDGGATDG